MNKFIEVNNTLINVKDIRKVEFLGDDVYLGLLPKTEKGIYLVDCIPFEYAKITTFSNEELILSIDLYVLESEENEDSWCKKNRAYISMSMQELYKVIKPIKIDGLEYGGQ